MSKKPKLPNRRSAGPFDKAMGIRIRTARMDVKMSQADLAEKLGVTFQQVQKYEKGTNRMPGARLHIMCSVLGKPLSFFMEEPTYKPNSNGEKIAQFVASRIGHQLCEAAVELPANLQQSLINFTRSLTKQAA